MTLDVRLLGQLAVIRDGHRLQLRSRPAQMLLAYLVLHPGQSVTRDKIAGILWRDSSTAGARKNLRQTLWRLRSVIGDEYLEVDARSLRLKPGRITSDVAKLRGDDVGDEPDALASAVESYQGELLPGYYEEWIQAASRPLRATYDDRMARLLEVLAEQERWGELRDWAERWIAHGPAPEPAYRALMRAHAGLGDLAGVASAYHRCVDMLRVKLGVGPSVETRMLYRRLNPDQDVLMGEGNDAPSPSTAVLPMPSIHFVGSKAVVEASVIIDRPHDEVYWTLLDPDMVPLCRSNVLGYDIIAGAPGKAGARVRVTRKLGTGIIQANLEAVEVEEGRWVKSRTFDSPISVEPETQFEDVTGGTRVTHRRKVEIPKGFFGELDDSAAAQLYAREIRSDFEKLKVLLETQ